MFSLYPTKNMTSGEGGMVSVADDEIERLVRLYRNQGMLRQYENEVVGLNNRMTDIHAAIGRVQLTKVDAWTATAAGQRALPVDATSTASTTPPVADGAVHVYHQYTVRVPEDRDGLAAALREEYGIGSGMFYPIPNHRLAPFAHRRRPAGDRAGGPRVPVAAGAPLGVAGRPRAHRDGRQHRWRRRVPDGAALRAGLVGIGMMGRNHARVLREIDGVELVGVADPAGDRHGVAGGARWSTPSTELVDARPRPGGRRRADGLPPRRRPRARRGRACRR